MSRSEMLLSVLYIIFFLGSALLTWFITAIVSRLRDLESIIKDIDMSIHSEFERVYQTIRNGLDTTTEKIHDRNYCISDFKYKIANLEAHMASVSSLVEGLPNELWVEKKKKPKK